MVAYFTSPTRWQCSPNVWGMVLTLIPVTNTLEDMSRRGPDSPVGRSVGALDTGWSVSSGSGCFGGCLLVAALPPQAESQLEPSFDAPQPDPDQRPEPPQCGAALVPPHGDEPQVGSFETAEGAVEAASPVAPQVWEPATSAAFAAASQPLLGLVTA
mmetsp:Transcript_9870/g.30710  ORF Transcript_9870/g.30710 Transcript_9870/m.30710 type:complete len:157 (+) Transcript_9870:764-1234(+)